MAIDSVTIIDKQDLLGQGVHAEIELNVAYVVHAAKAASWGYRGGAPEEPEYMEIGHVEVLNAPQTLEHDIIEFYGDDIEMQIMTRLARETEAARYRDDY